MSFFGSLEDVEEEQKDNTVVIESASLVFQINDGKEESDTIIRVSQSKLAAFNARRNYLKRNGMDIDLFDLAGNSKRRLQVYYKGEKYSRKN